MCNKCYNKEYWKKNKPQKKERITECLICKETVPKNSKKKGYCNSCYTKLYNLENPEKALKRKEKARKAWRKKNGIDPNAPKLRKNWGDGNLNKDGYIIHYKPDHPNCTNKNGSIAEHTIVMSEYLGRPLKKEENIHHKNGIRHDNRIENLELWTKKHPPGCRVLDKLNWCLEFINEYGEEFGFEVVRRS